MHLEQHERAIHAVRPGARGAGVTEARSVVRAAVHATSKLSGTAAAQRGLTTIFA
jgi:hypothetical protein